MLFLRAQSTKAYAVHPKCKVDNDNGHHSRQSACKDLERELVFSWLWKTVFLLPVTEPVIFVLIFLKNNLNKQIWCCIDACTTSICCLLLYCLFFFSYLLSHSLLMFSISIYSFFVLFDVALLKITRQRGNYFLIINYLRLGFALEGCLSLFRLCCCSW